MVTAEQIDVMRHLTTLDLEELIQRAGYLQDRFTDSNFVGITNGRQFCYRVSFRDDICDLEDQAKVFVDWNDGLLAADY